MNDKSAWALSARAIMEQIALNKNVTKEEFLKASIRVYQETRKNMNSKRPFAALDHNIMAYMIAYVFAGEQNDQSSSDWTCVDGRVFSRNVALVVGEQRAGWPSDVLGDFIDAVNSGSSEVDEKAVDFCEVMTEVIDCAEIYSVHSEVIP